VPWTAQRPARRAGASVFALALILVPAVASAWPQPDIAASVGNTVAVLGTPNDGGMSIELAALWKIWDGGGRVRFGGMALADDLGARIGRLRDPNDATIDLGAVELDHRDVMGAAWRLDAVFGGPRSWQPFASGTWGYYRLADDHRGQDRETLGSTGFSLGGGILRPLGTRYALGVGVRYHRLFNDVAGRYVNVGAEWRWSWGGGGEGSGTASRVP